MFLNHQAHHLLMKIMEPDWKDDTILKADAILNMLADAILTHAG